MSDPIHTRFFHHSCGNRVVVACIETVFEYRLGIVFGFRHSVNQYDSRCLCVGLAVLICVVRSIEVHGRVCGYACADAEEKAR